jgi:hypothetical protein
MIAMARPENASEGSLAAYHGYLDNARKRANKNDDASRRYICHIIISDRKIHLRHSLYDTAGVPQWTSYKCNLPEAQNNKLGGYLSTKRYSSWQ